MSSSRAFVLAPRNRLWPCLRRFRPSGPAAMYLAWQPLQYRQYTVAQRRSDPPSLRPSPTEEELEFTSKDVPPMPAWERMAIQGPADLTPKNLYQTALTYCAVAPKRTAGSAWKGRLLRDHGIDLYTLHYTATLLLSNPPGPVWNLGSHMLKTASDLNYIPSTISLMRLAMMISEEGPAYGKAKAHFRGNLDKFNDLVKEGGNPDALTVSGLMRLRGGNDKAALQLFDRAVQVAGRGGDAYVPAPSKQTTEDSQRSNNTPTPSRTPKWTFESVCHVERGKILLRMGDNAAAEAAFRTAAYELGSAEAFFQLGKSLPANSPESIACLLKASVSGVREACTLLWTAETFKSHQGGVDKREKAEHLRWAAEWHLLGRSPKAEKIGEARGTAS